ncbi:hypothetical protein [Paractinoplanes globisporus]|uniref:Uncharacterized protein n=1 Tax=Paractinoplanes globisporus TaxID=113565 RepID=A0ABW6WS12_9ACTN|nr:hypothetical protein [Actinoplanes globisporus]
MIGETPQPGEKPPNEGSPWSFSDPDPGWWRGETDRDPTDPPTGRSRSPRRRPPRHQAEAAAGGTGTLLPPGEAGPRHTGEAAQAHAAGVHDATRQLDPLVDPPMVERDHDRADAHRYDPMRPPRGHRPRRTAATVAADEQSPAKTMTGEVVADWAVETTSEHKMVDGKPAEKDEPAQEDEPDVMVLPEPSARNRPTVPLEPTPTAEPPEPIAPPHGPIPGLARQNRGSQPATGHPAESRVHPTEPLPRPTGDPETDARLERLENSPFWQNDPDQITEPLPPAGPAHAVTRRGTRRAASRTPVAASASLIALGLLAAFFAWVSAEPFWLAMGHGDRGYATVTNCTSSGVTQHCVGRFAEADGGFTISRVTLLGVGPAHRVPGTVSPARMVSPDSPRAYLGDTSPLLQLRWLLGFLLVIFCGYAIAGVTGARRLETGRARRGALLASLAGPLLLLAGFLIAAF